MDSVLTKPTTFTSLRRHFSVFNSTQTNKRRASSSISLSHAKTPSNPDDPTLKSSFPEHPLKRTIQSFIKGPAFPDANGVRCLRSDGLGMALLSVTATARVKISPFVAQLAANPTFVSGLLAWLAAQSIKVVLNFFVERKWDLRLLFASGGMPSSHSALCTALSTSVALCHGVADSLFPVCLGFSLIVMYDAIGVRRHAGMQAEVLNMIVEDLFQGHPISQRKLKELLGHTPSQVLAGALLGLVVACVCCQGFLVAT
ncbi:uncharacterized protein LOC112091474 [Morus notabilis]|uniref:uncharacterized protein LOC112091474 n=1 Tax=Morus notabilis TaxID=981085 RepID=UPI000CED70EB|nr:uncharacterized protein LOC112091474 [Morus notabilis]